jgi:hypothetical protein
MMLWVWLWKLSLIVGVSAFSLMALLVTIGGAWDIRRMIVRLRESSDDT